MTTTNSFNHEDTNICWICQEVTAEPYMKYVEQEVLDSDQVYNELVFVGHEACLQAKEDAYGADMDAAYALLDGHTNQCAVCTNVIPHTQVACDVCEQEVMDAFPSSKHTEPAVGPVVDESIMAFCHTHQDIYDSRRGCHTCKCELLAAQYRDAEHAYYNAPNGISEDEELSLLQAMYTAEYILGAVRAKGDEPSIKIGMDDLPF